MRAAVVRSQRRRVRSTASAREKLEVLRLRSAPLRSAQDDRVNFETPTYRRSSHISSESAALTSRQVTIGKVNVEFPR